MKFLLYFLLIFGIELLYANSTADETPTKAELIPQKEDVEDEKLRLMYQVFVYSQDLKNAFKTVKIALKRRPHSLYWHYKMAEVASWLGKGSYAIKSMDYIYRHTNNPRMKKKILKSALQFYQYKIAAPIIKEETMKNPTPKNIKDLIFVYNKIGRPELAAKYLEQLSRNKKNKKDREDLLREALKVYILLDDEESAKRVLSKLNKLSILKVKTAREMSYYYIPKKSLKKAYKALLKAWNSKDSQRDSGYLIQISDLGWYLQDFPYSVNASKRLIDIGKARLIDYDRVILHYRDKNMKIVEEVSFDAYKKFGKTYLFSTYMSILQSRKDYQKLYKSMLLLERSPKLFKIYKKDPNYYMMKAETLKILKKYDKAEKAYKKAIALNPNSSELKLALFWFYIDSKNISKLKREMFKVEENIKIDKSYWLPLAMSHYFLYEIDRAVYFMDKVRRNKKNIENDMTFAYLLQLRGDEDGFQKIMKKVFEYLDNKATPARLRNKDFLSKYLESGIYFMHPAKFEKLLKSSKSIIGESKYQDLSIAWAQKNNAPERIKIISNKFSNPKPWVELSVAMAESDYSKAQRLLYKHYMILPPMDTIIAAQKSGNIAFAKVLAFNAENNNKKSVVIYQTERELAQNYASTFEAKSGYKEGGDVDSTYFEAKNSHYIGRGYYVQSGFGASRNFTNNKVFSSKAPKNDIWGEIGVKKIFDRGSIEVKSGVKSESKNYAYFALKGNYKVTQKLTLETALNKGVNSEETSYLKVGGKKNSIEVRGEYPYLPSTKISLSGSYEKFYSQDDKYLGDGIKGKADANRQIFQHYPDFKVHVFTEYGNYKENINKKGVIDKITKIDPAGAVLPNKYLKTGTTIMLGNLNRENYTRVWRAYAEFTPAYDWLSESLDFSLNAGYGGSLFGQDKLRFDIKYNRTLGEVNSIGYGLNLNYKLLY